MIQDIRDCFNACIIADYCNLVSQMQELFNHTCLTLTFFVCVMMAWNVYNLNMFQFVNTL